MVCLITAEEVNVKIKKLKAQYLKARMRLRTPQKSGAAAGGPGNKKWMFYDSLSFLDQSVRKGTDNMKKVM